MDADKLNALAADNRRTGVRFSTEQPLLPVVLIGMAAWL